MKKYIYILALLPLLAISAYGFVSFLLPLQIQPVPSSTIFLDIHGQEIGEIVYSGSIRHREITYAEIPDFYIRSLVALEDQTFWTNNGVSLWGVGRSIWKDISAGGVVEWATTLSSGLIRNVFWIGESRTLSKKMLEFAYAVRLNHLFSKEEILTQYMNRVEFGYLNYGLASASHYYFGHMPKDLTRAEQIALLSLPKDPSKYDPLRKPKNFRVRFESIVQTLKERSIISDEEAQEILSEELVWISNHTNPSPYVTDFLNLKSPGTEGGFVQTSFDVALTQEVDILAKSTLTELAWRNVSDYGILVAERSILPSPSKERDWGPQLRVMLGGSNYQASDAGQVNTTLALRQPGSTVKPFTYSLAFERLGLTPEDTILDLPVAYKTEEEYSYEPKNYSQEYKWAVTLRQALSESINIPAIKLTERIGVSTLLRFLGSVGITSLKEPAEHYGLSLGLGSGEVSLYELLQAYTIFANEGKYCPFRLTPDPSPSKEGGENPVSSGSKITEQIEVVTPLLLQKEKGLGDEGKGCTQIIDPKYTDMVTSILTDRYAKLGWFPLYSSLDFSDRNVFVKTGTSRNFRDNWAIGFTDHYMIGVWTGNKSGENMKGVSGATGAGEIFRKIVYALEKNEQVPIPEKRAEKKQEYLTITNPLGGSIYQLYKNNAREKIQLRFQTNIDYDIMTWFLDGTKIESEFIDPTPGNHSIEALLMKDGEIVGKEKNSFSVQ